MTQTKDHNDSREHEETWRVLGSAAIAARYGVNVRTVAQWRRRGKEYGIPFPAPSTETTTNIPELMVPGWDESRLPEIDEWRRTMEARPEWRSMNREGDQDE